MKLPKSTIIAIDFVLISLGLTTVSLGAGGSIIWEAIGTSLIATGGVGLLTHIFSESPKVDGIKMVASTRNLMDPSIHNKKNKAKKIEMAGVSLTGFLREIANDQNQTIVNRVLIENTRLRAAFVHPDSPFLVQRAVEDNRNDVNGLRQLQFESIEYCLQFYKHLKKQYLSAKASGLIEKPKGTVQVKLIDFCPYLTIERYDGEIYWGLYTSDTAGEYAPMFLASRNENYVVYDKLKLHFNDLLNKHMGNASKNRDLFLISMESGEPCLRRELANQLLGKDRVDQILDGVE